MLTIEKYLVKKYQTLLVQEMLAKLEMLSKAVIHLLQQNLL